MTVCIAGICEENTPDAKIIFCTDTKVSGRLGSSFMNKTRILNYAKGGWRCLVSGEDSEIQTTLRFLRAQFRPAEFIDETNVLTLTRNALNERKVEKANELIQGKFGISYSEFLATGKVRLPDDIFRNATTEVELIKVEADFVIAGFDGSGFAHLAESEGTKAVIREDFAVAGEGTSLAQAILMRRKYHSMLKFDQALYTIFEAKKFAEGAPSVGDATSVTILHRNNSAETLSWEGILMFEEYYKKFGPQSLPTDLPIPEGTLKSFPSVVAEAEQAP